jgi:hypothetical protein
MRVVGEGGPETSNRFAAPDKFIFAIRSPEVFVAETLDANQRNPFP